MKTDLNIFLFTDFRCFLNAYAADRKKAAGSWSYGLWAMKLGLSGTSGLTMILHGQRNPGKEVTNKFIKYFKFNSKESQYFEDLIRLKKVEKDPYLSVLLMEKMGRLHPSGTFTLLSIEEFSALSHWYYHAIREMILLKGFKEDHHWISKKLRFKVTPRDIQTAIEHMLKIKLLSRNQEGVLYTQAATLDTERDIASEGIKRHHEDVINNSLNAIRSVPIDLREFNATTLGIKDSNIPKAKELIRDFHRKFIQLLEEAPADNIFQLNIQFFPITHSEPIKPKLKEEEQSHEN